MRTRKLVLLMLLSALAAAFVSTVPARADKGDQGEKDEIGLNLNVSCPDGKLVIDVKHRVVNDGDSGVTRYWANDSYKKHIRVWQIDLTTFCAVVQYEGTFVSTAGDSPAGAGPIGAGITGSMTGGYRATITGTTLNPSPAYHRKGNLGTFDYGWTGDPLLPAPSPFRWVDTYFLSGYAFGWDWWGWVYNAGDHGIWFNTAGNAGDITD